MTDRFFPVETNSVLIHHQSVEKSDQNYRPRRNHRVFLIQAFPWNKKSYKLDISQESFKLLSSARELAVQEYKMFLQDQNGPQQWKYWSEVGRVFGVCGKCSDYLPKTSNKWCGFFLLEGLFNTFTAVLTGKDNDSLSPSGQNKQ